MAHRQPSSQGSPPAAGLQRTSSFRHAVQRASARLNAWTHPHKPHPHHHDEPPLPARPCPPRPRPVSTCQPSVVLHSKRSSAIPKNFFPELVTVIATDDREKPSSPMAKDTGFAGTAVEDMVNAATKASSKLENFAARTRRPRLLDAAGSMRVSNTREDLAKPLSSKDAVQHRLLFVCASMSLAADFHEFQRRHARRQRQHRPAAAPESPSSPGGGGAMLSGAKKRALKDFVAAQAPIDARERADLEAAVLLGTKAQIVNAIGQSLRLGSSLGLLCAFEARHLADLSYHAFPELRMLLKDNAAATARIRSFDSAVEAWWGRQLDDYHQHFTSVRSRSNAKLGPMLSADLPRSPKLGKPSRPTLELDTTGTEAQAPPPPPPPPPPRKRSASDAVSPTGSPPRRVSVRSSRNMQRLSRLSLDKPLPPITDAPAVPPKSKLRQLSPSASSSDDTALPRTDESETAHGVPGLADDATQNGISAPPAGPRGSTEGTQFFEEDEEDEEEEQRGETPGKGDTEGADTEKEKEHATSQPADAVKFSPNAETRVDDLLLEVETSSMWHNTPVSIGIGPLPAVATVK